MGKETLPETIRDVEHLEDLLSAPDAGVIDTLARLEGDLLILGAGGKMGPTLARMAKRASEQAGVTRRVLAVSRFASDAEQEARFHAWGVETRRCDLLDRTQLKELPDAPNVVYMAGMKFGATGQEALTWAMNSLLPALVCQRFPHSRIVAFSTGNVYGLTPILLGGSVETDVPAPVGEYAMSCLGRERIFEYYSQTRGIPVALIRLNYAVEMRYGVLADLARRVQEGQPIDLGMGSVNVIWQADANAMTLRAFDGVSSPPFLLNVAGPEMLSVRRIAQTFGQYFGKPVTFVGSEAADALLNNGQAGHQRFGYPRVSAAQIMAWTANWVQRGGASLGKPTHFEARDGKF